MFCIDVIKSTARREIFTAPRKISRHAGTCPGHVYTGLGAKRRTLYFLNFIIKNENFKMLNPLPDG
jgi:hypothetical protein